MSTFVNGAGAGITNKRAFRTALGIEPIFDSLQQLRDFPITDLPYGSEAEIMFHTSSLDRGAGVFVWVPSSTKDDTNGSIVKPTGRVIPGRWVRKENVLDDGYVDIRWFGAIPETTVIDNGPIINQAIQSLPLYSGTDLVINGGYMRKGLCYIPSGIWNLRTGIIASGGMKLKGVSSSSCFLKLQTNSPGFMDPNPKTISAVSVVAGKLHITVNAHGKTGYTSGWMEGFTSGSAYVYLNTWWRLRVVDANTLRVVNYIPSGAYTISGATVDFDNWVVDFQSDVEVIGVGDVFGTQCESLTILANARSGGNFGSSGLYIAGAQQSYLYDVTVMNTGKINTICDVPADRLWCPDSIKGPGYMCTTSPSMLNGVISSEHHNSLFPGNPDEIFTLTTRSGHTLPRPAFYLRGAVKWYANMIQGEDSTVEIINDSSPGMAYNMASCNGPGVADKDGWETTFMHITGDAYNFKYTDPFFFGTFKNLVNDQSAQAIAQGENGIKTNFTQVLARAAAVTYTPNAMLLGPFANDAAAAAKAVPIGAAYRVTGGSIAWRQT